MLSSQETNKLYEKRNLMHFASKGPTIIMSSACDAIGANPALFDILSMMLADIDEKYFHKGKSYGTKC